MKMNIKVGDKVIISVPSNVKAMDKVDGGLIVTEQIFAKNGDEVTITSVHEKLDGNYRYGVDAFSFYLSPSIVKVEITKDNIEAGDEYVIDVSGRNPYSYNPTMLKMQGQVVTVKKLHGDGCSAYIEEDGDYIWHYSDLRIATPEDRYFTQELAALKATMKNLENSRSVDLYTHARDAYNHLVSMQHSKGKFKLQLAKESESK